MHMHITQWKIMHIKSVPQGSMESFWKEDPPGQLTYKFSVFELVLIFDPRSHLMLVSAQGCLAAAQILPSRKQMDVFSFSSQATDFYKPVLSVAQRGF